LKNNYRTDIDFARELDSKDKLKSYRSRFYIPKHKGGNDVIYFAGN